MKTHTKENEKYEWLETLLAERVFNQPEWETKFLNSWTEGLMGAGNSDKAPLKTRGFKPEYSSSNRA